MSKLLTAAAAFPVLWALVGPAAAAPVTPDVIFGSGNANGSFTIATDGDVELGLRAKVRFNAANMPENTFNYDGINTYTFANGVPGGSGFGFAPGSTSTASWNFEWSINSDVTGLLGRNLDDLTYLLSIDFDPTAGTNFLTFDPINSGPADHAIGDNNTGNGGGTSDPGNYATLIANNNVAQNSWNMEFFDTPPLFPFLNSVPGSYAFELAAFDGAGDELARTSISVEVSAVPIPAALPLLAGGLGFMGLMGWRRKRKAAKAS